MNIRSLLKAIPYLFVGLALQTVVAWSLFLYAPYTGGTGVLVDPPLQAGERTVTGFTVPADWHTRARTESWGIGKTHEIVSEAAWAGSLPGATAGDGRQAVYQGVSAGWPMRSFDGCDHLTPIVKARAPGPVVAVPAWLKGRERNLPVSPRWPAIGINAALFGAASWLLSVIVKTWRSRLRRTRGLCPSCGYTIRELPKCPECGERRPAVNGQAVRG
jgi:hypothetical protein